ncbi:MAG: 16S rRNA (guanine(966)-N(2))-methyltransferase RsmD [Panacagrimonas sp.]
MKTRRPGQLRIVGGAWRSRLIEFDAQAGVRPTPDRVRQTLFDWLAPRIAGARCLDLFAGSGALGLEALSRGASHADFVEQAAAPAGAIRAALQKFEVADRGAVFHADAQRWIERHVKAEPYEIVFLDPPYAAELLSPVLGAIRGLLKSDNRIYVEWPASARLELPQGYEWLREKQAGQVSFGLITYTQGVPS